MSCDLCGAAGPVKPVKIEGVLYDACENCARYGTPIEVRAPKPKRPVRTDERVVRADYAKVIREARKRAGKTQHEFAIQTGIKESDLHAWEAGNRTPTIKMAERLEKALHIRMLEAPKQEGYGSFSSTASGGGMTISDMLKKK